MMGQETRHCMETSRSVELEEKAAKIIYERNYQTAYSV